MVPGKEQGFMKNSILIVDDDQMNRELLKQMFEKEYDIIMAADGKEAITKLGNHMNDIVVILLDLVMPVVNGYQVLKVLNSKKVIDNIPVVLITAQNDEKTEFFCYSMGAAAIITKPFVAQTVRQRVNNLIEMTRNADELSKKVKKQNKTISEQQHKMALYNENFIDVVSNIVEFRAVGTGTHIKRVKGFTKIMAESYIEMYPDSGLTKDKIQVIVSASSLHDIGKIAVFDRILLKPGALDDEERQIMMSHTTKGCEILKMMDLVQDEEELQIAYDICRYHHERYDGRGYPDGLSGDQIPLAAQLVSIVDVYDALVSERVYKKSFDKETAYNMIINGECGVFAPKIINSFKNAKERIEKYSDEN